MEKPVKECFRIFRYYSDISNQNFLLIVRFYKRMTLFSKTLKEQGQSSFIEQLPMYIVTLSCSIILVIVIAMVITGKRKRERATLWGGIPIPEASQRAKRPRQMNENQKMSYGKYSTK